MTKRPDSTPGPVARALSVLKHTAVFLLTGCVVCAWPAPFVRADTFSSSVRPVMAIIIDDLGDSPLFARKLAALQLALTFSIIPHTRRTQDVLAIAREAGLETILHQPMEPVKYPQHDPGQGALFEAMDAGRIREILQENFALVPGVSGMNNHMGSRFTQDEARMEIVLAELKRRSLFVIDSLTHPRSQVVQAAARVGVPCLVRDVFLDNVRTAQAVLRQLRKTEAIARRKGRAIAIGHPKSATLQALQTWSKTRDRNILLLPVSGLLRPEPQKQGNMAETRAAP